jgi:site-specific DNA-methyltransferase (adenine-specific)
MAEDATIWICGFWNTNLSPVRLALENLGYSHLNSITILKPNAVPNFRGVRFQVATECMIWAKAWDKRYFAYKRMKAYNEGKQMKDYWEIPVNNRQNVGRHPTQKSVEQIKRSIMASTDKGDWVLDPFAGTCTTLKVAKMLNRNAIAIERGFYYKEWRTEYYQCTCGKKFKEDADFIKHLRNHQHTPPFLRDIKKKVGWGEQPLSGKITYRMFKL